MSIGPELRKSLIYTVLLVALFRGLALIPVFSVKQSELDTILANNPLLGAIDLFAGGNVVSKFSIVGAGIFPVLLATLIVNGASWVVPSLRELRERGEAGRKRLEVYSRVLTVGVAFLIAWAITQLLSREIGLLPGKIRWVTWPRFLPSLQIIGLFTLGSLLSTAISDLITKKGVYDGKGVLLIVGVFFSVFSEAPDVIRQWGQQGINLPFLAVHAAAGSGAIAISLFLVRSTYRVSVQAASHPAGSGIASGRTYIPFRYVYGGVLPVSAAIGSLAIVRITQEFFAVYVPGGDIARGPVLGGWVAPDSWWSWVVFALLITAFTYLSNFSLIWAGLSGTGPSVAEELKKRGNFIPGVRPGRRTEEYLSKVMHRITPVGALALCVLAVGLPCLVFHLTRQDLTVLNLSVYVVVQHIDGLWKHVKTQYVHESYSGLL